MTPVSCRFLVGLGLAATASLASSQSVRNDPLAPLPPGAERAVPQPIAPPPRMAPADLRESVNALGRRFNGIAGISVVSVSEGWQLDSQNQIVLCDATCAEVQADARATVKLLFGCAAGNVPIPK